MPRSRAWASSPFSISGLRSSVTVMPVLSQTKSFAGDCHVFQGAGILLRNGEQMLRPPHEQQIARQGGSRQHRLADRILRQQFVLCASLHHVHVAIFAADVELAGRKHGRGHEGAALADALLIDARPGFGVVYAQDATEPGVLTDNPKTLISRLLQRKLQTQYVREYFIPFRMMPDRMEQVREQLRPLASTPVNRDFAPVAYYFNVVLWSAQF